MNTVDKINLILKEAGISKVNLAKYLGVSRQMIYNYFDSNDLSKLSNDKCQLLFKLLGVKNEKELSEVEINDIYLQEVGSKIFTNSRKSTNVPKKNEVIELSGLRREEQELIRLRYFEDLTQSETASYLGINQVKVSREEKRVLKKMRTSLNYE